MSHPRRRLRGLVAVALLLAASATVVPAVGASGAVAPAPSSPAISATRDGGNARTGWYDAPGLAAGAASHVARLWDASVDGQVYAQPLPTRDRDGRALVLVATEADGVYALDPASGAELWPHRTVGRPAPTTDIGCSDLLPQHGITGTPVVDPVSRTAYLVARDTDAGGLHWWMHGLDLRTGVEVAGFPVEIAGDATNARAGQSDPSFHPATQLQRAGLLLLDGVVYAAFGSICDKPPFAGWVAGVPASGGAVHLWATERDLTRAAPVVNGDPGGEGPGGGIWQSGSGIAADAAGHLLVATGNDYKTSIVAPEGTPPDALGNAVVRLAPDAAHTGRLAADQFWSPPDSDAQDANDGDLGSGGPVVLPDAAGTTAGPTPHPHLLIQPSKNGTVYLLDRDHLGGQHPLGSATDGTVDSRYQQGPVFGRAAYWPGEGGRAFLVAAPRYVSGFERGVGSTLRALSIVPDPDVVPRIVEDASADIDLGFGSSSPIVTSNGTNAGSGVVWVVRAGTSDNPAAELRGYAAQPTAPTDGTAAILPRLVTLPLPRAAKFAPPSVGGGRMFVGTRDGTPDVTSSTGHVLAFGSALPATASTGPIPATTRGQTSSGTVTVTAIRDVTISSLTTGAGSEFSLAPGSPTPPFTIPAGASALIPVRFAPTGHGSRQGTLTLQLDAGVTLAVPLAAEGREPGPYAVAPASVAFGSQTCGSAATLGVPVQNEGDAPLTVNGATVTGGGFSVGRAPGTLAPGERSALSVTFTPGPTAGSTTGTLTVTSDGRQATGVLTVALTGSCAPPGQLLVEPTALDVGPVLLGSSVDATIVIRNVGGQPLTVNKSKPPAAGTGFSATATLDETTVLAPGESRSLGVRFAPLVPGAAQDVWRITTTDGPHDLAVSGTGIVAAVSPPAALPGPPLAAAHPPFAPHHLSVRRDRRGRLVLRWTGPAAGTAPIERYAVRLLPAGRRWVLGPRTTTLLLGSLAIRPGWRLTVAAASADGVSPPGVIRLRPPASVPRPQTSTAPPVRQ